MKDSQPLVFWKLASLVTRCVFGLIVTLSVIVFVLFGISLVLYDVPLLTTFHRPPAFPIHVVLGNGQLQVGTQTDVSLISEWVKGIRNGTTFLAVPVVDTFDVKAGLFQLSWITSKPPEQTSFGFACPMLTPVILAVLFARCLNALRRSVERRCQPKSDQQNANVPQVD
jgi:hypothetical protein